MRISLISKVEVHKATTAVNDTSFCSTILLVFIQLHPIPVDQAGTLICGFPKFTHREDHSFGGNLQAALLHVKPMCGLCPTVPSQINLVR